MTLKLSNESADGARLIPKENWTDFDNQIFKWTEDYCSCISNSGCELVAIGELANNRHVISRCIFTPNRGQGEGCYSFEGDDARSFEIATNSFVYEIKKNLGENDAYDYFDMSSFVLQGDGEYDIFESNEIPEEYIEEVEEGFFDVNAWTKKGLVEYFVKYKKKFNDIKHPTLKEAAERILNGEH